MSFICETRLVFFSREKPEIPVPHRYEDLGRVLRTLREDGDRLHRAYQRSIEELPTQPAITPNVLRSLPDDDAERVFDALEREGKSPEDILMLRTHRGTACSYAECKQETYEQQLLLNALKDVRKMQTLLLGYIQEQTALTNRNDNPDLRKANRARAFDLLNIISEIGNGNCIIPNREPQKREKQSDEEHRTDEDIKKIGDENKLRAIEREKFRYESIRNCETLRDEKGNLILSMPLMRSLALLHLRFNDLNPDSAMNASSIALAGHPGEDLLRLARSELNPAEYTPLHALSKNLKAMMEPQAQDFWRYLTMFEALPELPRLVLTLLHKDISEAHLQPMKNNKHDRDDLAEQYSKGKDIITDTERAVLMRELIEYFSDYVEALSEAGETEESEGFRVRNAYRIYSFLRENARKYLFQSGVNFIYLTGSDHGVKHLIQGDVRFSTKVAEQLKWPARDRVCLRQIAVDHDLGYTHTAMQRFSMHKGEGIPLDHGYYALTKDHPLYSSAYFEVHRPQYEEYFGKQGAGSIGLSILDHSEVKGHLRDRDPAKRIQSLFCRIDCMAVSADLKNAPAFTHDKVLIAMSKAFEAAEYLKEIDSRMENLWKEGMVRIDEYKWLANVQTSLRTIADKVKRYLLGLSKEIYKEDPPFQQAYYRAMDENYDPFDPKFPTQRDFGSNAIRFAGIDVESTNEREILTARISVQPLFFAVAEYFGEKQGPHFATSAMEKLLKSFDRIIHDPAKLIRAFYNLPLSWKYHTEKDIEKKLGNSIEHQQHYATHVHFEFQMPEPGASSPLIKQMKKHMPSLERMRKLMASDFKKVKATLGEIAENSRNPKMLKSIRRDDLVNATNIFLEGHFSLPK